MKVDKVIYQDMPDRRLTNHTSIIKMHIN